MSGIVSIIIPVYNTEAYINRCIESCFIQSNKNIEIIAIDDGSTDGSLQILSELALRDPRLTIVAKQREGVVKARFVGYQKASGDYLYFLDSDDWLEVDAIADLVNCSLNEGTDIVASGFYIVDDKSRHIGEQYSTLNISLQEFCSLFLQKKINGGLCGKLFKRKIWTIDEKDINLNLFNNEDYLILIMVSLSVSVVSLIQEIGYNYYQRPGSASRQKTPSVASDILYVTRHIKILLSKQQFYIQLQHDLITFCEGQLYYAILCNVFCFKDLNFKDIYTYVESSLKHIKNRKMYLILNSFKYGRVFFILTVGLMNNLVKLNAYFRKKWM